MKLYTKCFYYKLYFNIFIFNKYKYTDKENSFPSVARKAALFRPPGAC